MKTEEHLQNIKQMQKENMQCVLIQKHLNFTPSGDLRMLSVEHFVKTGKASGNLFIALKEMLDEYGQWILGNKTLNNNHHQPPALTEEQMEQEASIYVIEEAAKYNNSEFPDWNIEYFIAKAYKDALRKHAQPAPVADEVLDAIADDILHMPAEDAVYAGEIVKILKKHLTPQP